MKKPSQQNEKLNAVEAARKLNRRLGYVYLLLREGKLRGQRIDGYWRIDPSEVQRFAEQGRRRVPAEQPK